MAKPTIWWPLDSFSITGGFGVWAPIYDQLGLKGHNGIDCAAAFRSPVYAADDGQVVVEGWNTSWSGAAGGISCIIKHSWGYTGYAHFDQTIVSAGQWVKKGQLLGYEGMTGAATGPHVHFETFPLSVNWGNGYSGRVNPASIATIVPRGTVPSQEPGGGTVAVPYHLEDYIAKLGGGRKVNPGGSFYLHTSPNPKNTSQASNVIGRVGQYILMAHIYLQGNPGDEVSLVYIWQTDPNGAKPANSDHYPKTVVIPESGFIADHVAFTRYAGGDKPVAVYLRAAASSKNKKPVMITRLDSDALALV